MAVYTKVEPEELAVFLGEYRLGELVGFQGIGEGIENTNYFVTTTRGEYVLTLFESIGFEDLPYYLDLMAFLAEHGVQSAHPLPDRNGSYLRTFNSRPATLLERLRGRSVETPNLRQCRAIGESLGHLHVEGQAFKGFRENARGPGWWYRTAERLLPHLDPPDAELLGEELRFQHRYCHAELPRGVIHADLFRDNALFVGDELTGIIDFYYACNDALLYDLAVTANDWCTRPDGSLESEKTRTILSAYNEWRPLRDEEHALWPVMLRAAALRFWLSRLQDRLFPRRGEITRIKDPNEFRRVLEFHRTHHAALPALWV